MAIINKRHNRQGEQLVDIGSHENAIKLTCELWQKIIIALLAMQDWHSNRSTKRNRASVPTKHGSLTVSALKTVNIVVKLDHHDSLLGSWGTNSPGGAR